MPALASSLALAHRPAEYEPWLARGAAGGFRPPSDASRKALEGEASLSIGSKKLPVEAGLRAAALDISRTLQLDEVQSYILLRRWVAKAGSAALAGGGGGSGGIGGSGGGGGGALLALGPGGSSGTGAGVGGSGLQAGASLSPAQRQEVAQLYFSERLHLLKSIEDLLWEGERALGLVGRGWVWLGVAGLAAVMQRLRAGVTRWGWQGWCWACCGVACG